MKNIQVTTLIDTIESTHLLTKWYLSLLKNTDVHKCFEVNNIKLNSLYWLTAHIANSEDTLLLQALGQRGHNLEWLSKYQLGALQDIKIQVSYKKLVEVSKTIHENCIGFLRTLSDEDLKKENTFKFNFDGEKTFKAVILHHIRHEGIHAGHLSILCKLNGLKTI